jgi:hypothetical protein
MIFELVSKTHSEPIDRVDLSNIGIQGAKTYFMGRKQLSEELDVQASLIEDSNLKDQAVAVIKEKYGLMAKMMIKGSNSNRAIIKLDQL